MSSLFPLGRLSPMSHLPPLGSLALTGILPATCALYFLALRPTGCGLAARLRTELEPLLRLVSNSLLALAFDAMLCFQP